MQRFSCVLLMLGSLAPCSAQPPANWKPVWADEFNAPANTPPDAAKWTYDLGGGGWGNRELEVYTNHLDNVFHDGAGHLVIRVLSNGSGGYTSARIKSQGKFSARYGKIEARIRIPYGQGIWPAFWMLGIDIDTAGWPTCGEIDIMENIGNEPSVIHGTVHGPGYSGGNGIGHPFQLQQGGFADDFHVYSVEWWPHAIVFLVDDRQYFEVTPQNLPAGKKWVYDHPFFLLLNVAVGGSWPGSPDATSTFPQEMLIDWVRVWEPAAQRPHEPRP
jgi:beta-glucanase (GH16 family)